MNGDAARVKVCIGEHAGYLPILLAPYNLAVASAPFLSLIIPAYNEEQRLTESLAQIEAFVRSQTYETEVLIMENGSTDRTLEVAQSFAKQRVGFSAHHIDQRGKGRAVGRGMLTARGDFRMMLDADLSMPVDQIPRFLPPQQSADVVIASREAPGAVRYNEPGYRHIGGRLITTMIKIMVLPGIQDTQCGFKCFRAAIAEDLFSKQTLMGWSFDVEILYIARLRGNSIVELPIPWYYRPQSHVRPFQDALRFFIDLLRLRSNARQGLYGRTL